MHVVTWHLQADAGDGDGERRWQTDIRRLFQTGADLVCLQGCPAPPADAVPATPPPLCGGPASLAEVGARYMIWNAGTFRRPHYVLVYHVATDAAGLGVHLAVARSFAPAGADAPLAPSHLLYAANPHERGRPAIGLRLPYNGLGLDVYCLDALAPQGRDGAGLLATFQSGAARWFAAGGFACEPAAWTDLPRDVALCEHNARLLHPGGGTAFDYAFIRPGPAVRGNVLSHFIAADHYPVAYAL